jgi:hypothetical protein
VHVAAGWLAGWLQVAVLPSFFSLICHKQDEKEERSMQHRSKAFSIENKRDTTQLFAIPSLCKLPALQVGLKKSHS